MSGVELATTRSVRERSFEANTVRPYKERSGDRREASEDALPHTSNYPV